MKRTKGKADQDASGSSIWISVSKEEYAQLQEHIAFLEYVGLAERIK